MLVQKFRLQRGWTQEELATVSGLSVRTIQRIERGAAASSESLKALAAAFGIDFRDLKDPDMEPTNTLASGAEPATPSSEAALRAAEEILAFEHVRQIKRFYFQILAYAVVIPTLAAMNLIYSPRFIWVVFPALFWGLGIAIGGLRLFANWPWGAAWERRQVEKYLGRPL